MHLLKELERGTAVGMLINKKNVVSVCRWQNCACKKRHMKQKKLILSISKSKIIIYRNVKKRETSVEKEKRVRSYIESKSI